MGTKGVLLAGGQGKRLKILTKNNNKHLLPIYDKPMVFYPMNILVSLGIKDVIMVTGGKKAGEFIHLFQNGEDFKLNRLYYTYQELSDGISAALGLCQNFCTKKDDIVVILGDNYLENPPVEQFLEWKKSKCGSGILLKKTKNPYDFGICNLDENENILEIEEKPKNPQSDLAIIGCYFFQSEKLWSYLDKVKMSERKEYEITDVLKMYLKDDDLSHYRYESYWKDCGTPEGILSVAKRIEKIEKNKKL